MSEINKDQAENIARTHVANTIEIFSISDFPPNGIYNPSNFKDFWYATIASYPYKIIGHNRVIVISKKSGEVISDQLVGE